MQSEAKYYFIRIFFISRIFLGQIRCQSSSRTATDFFFLAFEEKFINRFFPTFLYFLGPCTTARNGRIEVVALQIATNWLQTDPSQEIGIQPQLE